MRLKPLVPVMLAICLMAASALVAHAKVINLIFEWDPNTETDLSGYTLYWSTTKGGPYTMSQIVGKVTTCTEMVDIEPGESLFFVLDAFDLENNHSGYSNEVGFFLSDGSPGVGPAPPTFRLKSWAVVSSTP